MNERRNALRVGLRAILEKIGRDMDDSDVDFEFVEGDLLDAARIAKMLREIPLERHPEEAEARS